MSNQIVKRQILLAADALNLPTAAPPSKRRLADACDAAKLLRNRILREHIRVVQNVEKLRQANLYDEDSEGEDDGDADTGHNFSRGNDLPASSESAARQAKIAREEFLLIVELMLVERIVLPVLYAHGMSFPDTLLLQLLKLVAVMLMPTPRFSHDEVKQNDALVRLKRRCGCDEFCALLIQSLAPVTEKRVRGALTRDDFVLLEISLTILSRLLDGKIGDNADAVGAFCRNHGFEFLLVVTNQNLVKSTSEAVDSSYGRRVQHAEKPTTAAPDAQNCVPAADGGDGMEEKRADESAGEGGHIFVPDDDATSCSSASDDESADEAQAGVTLELDEDFRASVNKMLESEEKLRKLNNLLLSIFASILRSMPASEIVETGTMLGQASLGNGAAGSATRLLCGSQHFRECVREKQNWRYVARSRNGAINSNGIIVKMTTSGDRSVADGGLDAPETHGESGGLSAVGSVSSLLSTRRKDPLQVLKDMDRHKRGKFVKGMYQNYASRSDLPLPVKLKLCELIRSFMRVGFEPLATISWPYLSEGARAIELATLEYKELAAGYKNSSERMELTSPFNGDMYCIIASGLQFMTICSTVLQLNREMVSQTCKHPSPAVASSFTAGADAVQVARESRLERRQQWQGVLHIITLEHCNFGFSVLRAFMACADLRRRLDVCVVVTYLAEIFLTLHLLIDGNTLDNPSVCAAAHALAATALYTEENTKIMFELIGEYVSRAMPIVKAQACTLFVFSMFQLMERCSFRGYMIQPVRRNHARRNHNDKRGGKASKKARTAAPSNVVMDDVDDYTLSTDDKNHVSPGISIAEANRASGNNERTNEMRSASTDIDTSNEVNSSREGVQSSFDTYGVNPASTAHAEDEHRSDSDRNSSEQDSDSQDDEEEEEDDAYDAQRRVAAVMMESDSVASSSYSSRTTDREVAVSSYLRRIATTRSIGLLYSTFSHWRINDADVNLSLTYIMEALMCNGCVGVLYNIGFLLLMRDVLVYGKETHPPLYCVCDRIVYDFFNPAAARKMDQRAAAAGGLTVSELSRKVQSYQSLEVALRCSRALFNFSATDYTLLEEKAMPHTMSYTMQELPPSPAHRSVSSLSGLENDELHDANGNSGSDEWAVEDTANYDSVSNEATITTASGSNASPEQNDFAKKTSKRESATSRKRHRTEESSDRTKRRKESASTDE